MDPRHFRAMDADRMTTIARTPDATTAPSWLGWATRLALGWAVAYGAVRVWFATGHAPSWNLPSDLLIPGWASVAACLASAGLVPPLDAAATGRRTGTCITAYFGVGLIQMIGSALQGKPGFDGGDLPAAFFWVAVPCYLVWGLGLATATYGYYGRTRKPGKWCC